MTTATVTPDANPRRNLVATLLAEAVRRRLAELQAPRRERLQWQAFLKRQAAHHRRLKAALNGELQRLGLSLKGLEARGVRQTRRLTATGRG